MCNRMAVTDPKGIPTYNVNTSYTSTTANPSGFVGNYASNTHGTISTPKSGSPFLSKWTWDSAKGNLAAEIMTPHGVIVIVNSSAPSLATMQVQQVFLQKCDIERVSNMAKTNYNFALQIQMVDGTMHRTSGTVSIDDNAVITDDGMTYDYTEPHEKPKDRSKYIKWICEHMIEDDDKTYCDECKTQHRR